MDIQPGQYFNQLRQEVIGSSLFDIATKDTESVIRGIAEAGYLYPIEAVASSVIFGVLGTFFGGIIFTPVLLFTASVLTMAPFCRLTRVFQESFQEVLKADQPYDLERRQELVNSLKEKHTDRQVLLDKLTNSTNREEATRAAIRVQSVVRGHQARSLFKGMFGSKD